MRRWRLPWNTGGDTLIWIQEVEAPRWKVREVAWCPRCGVCQCYVPEDEDE